MKFNVKNYKGLCENTSIHLKQFQNNQNKIATPQTNNKKKLTFFNIKNLHEETFNFCTTP